LLYAQAGLDPTTILFVLPYTVGMTGAGMTGALLLHPTISWDEGLQNFLPWLAVNLDPPHFHLLSS
jgi:hypothetical protein